MSIVAEVVASISKKGEPPESPVVNKMEHIMVQSEKARVEVCQALSSRYEQLNAALHDTTKLQQLVDKCLLDVADHEKLIQEDLFVTIEGTIGEVENVSCRWKAVSSELQAVNTILNVHNLLERSHKSLLKERFLDAAHALSEVDGLLENASRKDIEGHLHIITALREELILKTNLLIYSAGEVWKKYITWNKEDLNDGSSSSSFIIENLEKTCSNGENECYVVLQQMLSALHSLGQLEKYIRRFGKSLMELVVKPIVCNGAIENMENRPGSFLLEVTTPPQRGASVGKPSDVLLRLKRILEFLYKVFFHVKLKSGKEEEEMTLMCLLGKEISEEFLKLVLKECLAESVPCNRKDLRDFEDTVQSAANEFHEFLIYIEFYKGDKMSLLDYAANVELVFSNKACADVLSKARQLMLQPLHVVATISRINPEESLVVTNESGGELEKSTKNLKKILTAQTFNLPRCKVSVSICELVNLIYDVLEEACESSPEYAGRLFYTVRNILTLYCSVVPTAHSHTLSTIPQHAALVHNNSMFLAHHCLSFGHLYRNRFPPPLRDHTLTTTDLVELLRMSACNLFLKAMRSHKSSLLETLKEGFCSPSLGCDVSAISYAEQCVKQCLDQLHRLHTVWQDVLPYSVYTKSMGTLAGSVVEEVVTRITGLQDISADSALALVVVLNLLKDDVPKLFKVDGEDVSAGAVIREVKLWGKMTELIIVLEASLRELLDRWLDGKGPFALYFTPEEAKQLIRALFQNTHKRAEVLSKIK